MEQDVEFVRATVTMPSIRPDLLLGHAEAWEIISKPGTWWSGAERLELARASRFAWDCELCSERKASLSPKGLSGSSDRHKGADVCPGLSGATIDAVHRLVRDQNRLSREWLDELVKDGVMSKAQYVELVGVVTRAVSMDVFHFAMGLDPKSLPSPAPGEPSGYTPPGLAMEEAWVPMILAENLGPNEKDLYGTTGNVIRALSSVPDEVRALRQLSSVQYLALENMRDFLGGESVGRSIDRSQTELIAARVSALHECFY